MLCAPSVLHIAMKKGVLPCIAASSSPANDRAATILHCCTAARTWLLHKYRVLVHDSSCQNGPASIDLQFLSSNVDPATRRYGTRS